MEGIDPLGLHVPHEVHEVAAIRLERVVGEQGVADPGDQGAGGGGAALLVASRTRARRASTFSAAGKYVAVEEIAALGHEGDTGRDGWPGRQAGAITFITIDLFYVLRGGVDCKHDAG